MNSERRPNQRSVYLDHDIQKELDAFEKAYPLLSFSMINNAALRLYFELTRGGVDGNLRPLEPEKRVRPIKAG